MRSRLKMLQALLRIEILDLRRDQNLEIVERKATKRADAGFACFQSGPEFIDRRSDRRHDAETRYDDTAACFTLRHSSALSHLTSQRTLDRSRRPLHRIRGKIAAETLGFCGGSLFGCNQ